MDWLQSLIVKVLQKQISYISFRVNIEVYVYKNPLASATWSFRDGLVEMNGRGYARLIGGFGDGKPMFTVWQAGELLNLGADVIKKDFTRNASNFQINIDYKDLKSAPPESPSQKPVDITKFLKGVGYSQSKLNATKQWLVFSYSGMMKLVKIAKTKESWVIYDRFLEEYFKTKAENQVMKKSIKEEMKELEQDRYKISGLAVFNPEQDDRVEAQKRLLNLDNRLARMKSAIDNESIRKALEKQAKLTESKNQKEYVTQSQFGERFNSKIGAKTVGRLFKIIGLAKKANRKTIPYQQFVPEYAVNIINNDNEKEYAIFYKWNYSKCSRFVNQWLLDHDYHDMFYSITEKEALIKFIDALYDKYINHVEVLSLM